MEMVWWYPMQLPHYQIFRIQGNHILKFLNLFNRGKLIQMTPAIMHKLLNALPECSEWGRVYILDFLADNMATSFKDIDETIARIIPHLAHSNCAVVLSAAKVIIKYMEYVNETEKIRSICRKMAPPLISLMNNDPEI